MTFQAMGINLRAACCVSKVMPGIRPPVGCAELPVLSQWRIKSQQN
jgi:hypothetical protein